VVRENVHRALWPLLGFAPSEAVDGLFGDPHTHTNMAGAVVNAESVVSGLRDMAGDPLAQYLSDKGNAIVPYKP
jgi:hypothetical protein